MNKNVRIQDHNTIDERLEIKLEHEEERRELYLSESKYFLQVRFIIDYIEIRRRGRNIKYVLTYSSVQ